MFLRALTPIHVGVGHGGEIVDLQVQRDEFGFPCIWSSSLKGAMRSNFTMTMSNNPCIRAVFGPEPASPEVSEYSSALNVLDVRLLLIPVRSIRGVWVYATSPHLLGYLATYLEVTRAQTPAQLQDVVTGVTSKGDILVDENKAVLNEESVALKVDKDLCIKLFSNILPQQLLNRVTKRGLVVLDDDLMKTLARKSMLIQYRVRLSRKTKTVEEGPWSEEYLPEETMFVSAILGRAISDVAKSRTQCVLQSDICSWVEEAFNSKLRWKLWLGGKETLGRGFVEVYLVR